MSSAVGEIIEKRLLNRQELIQRGLDYLAEARFWAYTLTKDARGRGDKQTYHQLATANAAIAQACFAGAQAAKDAA